MANNVKKIKGIKIKDKTIEGGYSDFIPIGSDILHLKDGIADGSVRGVNAKELLNTENGYKLGINAIAIGLEAEASGNNSYAEGNRTKALGDYSHAEGSLTEASGNYSHAEGYRTKALLSGSHTEGFETQALGFLSHAEGDNTQASGPRSHAEGHRTYAFGAASHSLGAGIGTSTNVLAQRRCSYISTSNYQIDNGTGLPSTVIAGNAIIVDTESKVADIIILISADRLSFTTQSSRLGHILNQICGIYSFSSQNIASGSYSHTEGYASKALGSASHAEGQSTVASGSNSHALGFSARATGNGSHALGESAEAIGNYSHTLGQSTEAIGNYSHAEGDRTKAIGNYSHTEGRKTTNIYNKNILLPYFIHGDLSIAITQYPEEKATLTIQQSDLLLNTDIIGSYIEIYRSSSNFTVQTLIGIITLYDTTTGEIGISPVDDNYEYSLQDFYDIQSGNSNHFCIFNTLFSSIDIDQYKVTGNYIVEYDDTIPISGNFAVITNGTTIGLDPEVLHTCIVLVFGVDSFIDPLFENIQIGDYVLIANNHSINAFVIDKIRRNYNYFLILSNLLFCSLVHSIYYSTSNIPVPINIIRIDQIYLEEELSTSGEAAHSLGINTGAIGNNSHTQNLGTIALSDNQTVIGKYNLIDDKNEHAFIIGNGVDDTHRSNAAMLDWEGNLYLSGLIKNINSNTNSYPSSISFITSTNEQASTAWTGDLDTTELLPGKLILYELVQGSAPGLITLELTLSDGTTTGPIKVRGLITIPENDPSGMAVNLMYNHSYYYKNSILHMIYNGLDWIIINAPRKDFRITKTFSYPQTVPQVTMDYSSGQVAEIEILNGSHDVYINGLHLRKEEYSLGLDSQSLKIEITFLDPNTSIPRNISFSTNDDIEIVIRR